MVVTYILAGEENCVVRCEQVRPRPQPTACWSTGRSGYTRTVIGARATLRQKSRNPYQGWTLLNFIVAVGLHSFVNSRTCRAGKVGCHAERLRPARPIRLAWGASKLFY